VQDTVVLDTDWLVLCVCVCIGHILHRNCLIKHVIEGTMQGRIKVTERRGRRRKWLLDDLNEKRSYCKLKEKLLDRSLWRSHLGSGYGLVVIETTVLINK